MLWPFIVDAAFVDVAAKNNNSITIPLVFLPRTISPYVLPWGANYPGNLIARDVLSDKSVRNL
jgi:hypothetical protein